MARAIQDFSMDYFSLKGKKALVTGGNRGLGQGYALALAKAGADVMITATEGRDVSTTQRMIEQEGRKFGCILGDLMDSAFRAQVVPACCAQLGGLDILVNNAGTIRRAPLLEYQYEDWSAVMELNLNAVYQLSQEAAVVMAGQGSGKIINICSMLTYQGGKFVPPYTASKHAVAGLTKSFANELAVKNIQVNAIAPGYIETDNTIPIREDENRYKEITARIPADEWGTPQDLMGAVVFLASRASNYMNGHVLAVDGGWLAR